MLSLNLSGVILFFLVWEIGKSDVLKFLSRDSHPVTPSSPWETKGDGSSTGSAAPRGPAPPTAAR